LGFAKHERALLASNALELGFDAHDVEVEGPATRFQSSPFAERAFCATCGSHLWMRDTQAGGDSYELMPGLFDEARGWVMRSEIYTDRRLASVDPRRRPQAGDPRRIRAEELLH
jgi:hypothetical protein